jgi:general secretion pathway protein D
MRGRILILRAVLLACALAVPCFAADEPANMAPVSCGNGVPGGLSCIPTKEEMKEARQAFARGIKLEQQKNLDGAFAKFDEAMRLMPRDPQFLTAREMVKAQLVFNHVEQGNAFLTMDARIRAAAEFREALNLDPDNSYARERLEEATRTILPTPPADFPGQSYASEIHVQPKKDRATFHFRGDTRGLFAELGTAFGLTAQFDDSVQTKQVRFFIDDVDFYTALKLACEVSKTMWTPLDAHQILIAADTPENHKQFDRMSLRTFILPPHGTPQEAADLVTTMRNMFDLRFVTSGQTADTVEIRAPGRVLDALSTLLEQLSNQRPQVMLDVRVYQISHQLTRNIGLHVPDTFNLYNIPAVALAGLAGIGSGSNIQQLINQLISSGGINQAGSGALSGLLAQLGGQQSSIFNTPLATFGGGLTFEGLSLDQLEAQLSLNESWVHDLENMQLRAGQGADATFHLGEKYPILNASYAPIYNSPQISQVLGNQSYIPPFPSVSYEDLGLEVKAKPTIHGDSSVSLQLEIQVRSLTGQSANGVPVISNREYKGSINLNDGEPAVVAGEISHNDTLSMSGVPGFGALPLLNQAMVTNTKTADDDELMIIITPHVLANTIREAPEIWLSEK